MLDHIIDVQQLKGNKKGVGYEKCPPPLRHNYTHMPDEEDMPRYEPSVPLDYEEFSAGLGFNRTVLQVHHLRNQKPQHLRNKVLQSLRTMSRLTMNQNQMLVIRINHLTR